MSGRRAAENTNTTPNDARPIWLTPYEVAALSHVAAELDDQSLADIVRSTIDRWDAAPADPAEAAEKVMRIYFDHRWGAAADIDSREATIAVLVALGLRRQDNPTP